MKVNPTGAGWAVAAAVIVMVAGLCATGCSPSERSAVAAQSTAGSCADGGPCAVGDTGPGGGVVFFDAEAQQEWGRYLEAAPAGWHGAGVDPVMPWCDLDPAHADLSTGEAIGSGAANTARIITACGQDTAAGLAASYRGGGMDDWSLPSKDELRALYQHMSQVGGLASDLYWSSTQYGGDATFGRDNAWAQVFDRTSQVFNGVNNDNRVRPIRAF